MNDTVAGQWLGEGEKYALLGMEGHFAKFDGTQQIGDDLFALPQSAFQLPDHWRTWLGTIRVEDIERANLYILAKAGSLSPTIVDGENRQLRSRVEHFYTGLQLSRKLRLFADPFLATGGRDFGEAIDLRQFAPFDRTGDGIVMDLSKIDLSTLAEAERIGDRLGSLVGDNSWSKWRLLRCLAIFQDASNSNDILERIHQFTRCIDGLILSEPRGGLRQFKSRTELFVGPKHHDLMGEAYQLRSEVEHLHEHRRLEVFNRAIRIRIAELEAVVEWVARSCLARIVCNSDLSKHFATATTLHDFWNIEPAERRDLWGAAVNPYKMLDGFDFDRIPDERLGQSED